MDKARHLANFKQALYELFGIGHDQGSDTTEFLPFSPSVGKRLEVDRCRNWLHAVSGASSTAHSTARIIYAQFMPELRALYGE